MEISDSRVLPTGTSAMPSGGHREHSSRLLPDARWRRERVCHRPRRRCLVADWRSLSAVAPHGDGGRPTPQRDRRARALRDPGPDIVAARPWRRWAAGREQPPRAAAAADDGSAGRRRAGAQHQRLLVVRRRRDLARQIVPAQNEGLAKWVASASRSLRRDGFGGAAASRSGGRAAARTPSSGSGCAAPRSADT